VESKLRVMLEEDYKSDQWSVISDQKKEQQTTERRSQTTQFIRDIILPEIEKEVNAGSNFAQLRQIYNSVILATWFKRNLKKSFLGQVYMDQNKVAGVDIKDKNAKEKIYQQYLEALKKGAYNYIKEDYDPVTQQIIPRKYFSGGVNWKFGDGVNSAMLSTKDNSFLKIVKTAGLVLMASGLMLASPVAQAESPQPVPTATVAVTVSVDLVNPLIRDMEALKEAIKLSEGQGFEGLTSISNASNKVKLPQDAEQREKAIKYLMEIVRNYVNYDFRFVEQSIELLIGAKAPDLVEALVNILKDEKISKPMKLNVVRYLVKIGTGDALRLVAKSIYEIKKTVTGMPYHTDTIDEIELIPSNQWDLFVVKFLEESAQRTPEEQLSFLIDRLSETKKSAYLLATALMDRYPNLGEDAVKKILNILDQAGQEKMESAVQHDVSLALSHLILLQPQYHETFWKFLEGKVIGDLQFANATVAEKVARINQIRQQNEFAVMRSSDFNVATLKALINDPDREVGFELYRKNLSQNPQSAEKSFVVRLVDGQLELRYFDFDERDTVIVGDKAVEREFKRMGFLEKEGVFIAFLGATVHTDGRAASVTLLPSLNVDGHSHPAISLEEFKKKFGGVGAYGRNPATTPSTNDRFLFQSVQEGLKAVKAAKAVLEGGKKKPSLKDRKKHGAIETRRFEKMAMRRDQRLKRNVVDAAMAAISTDQSSSSDAAMVGENKAQTSLNKETTAPGGIDFSAIGGSASGGNPNKFNLETQGKGMDPNMPFDPAQLQGVTIDGFTPVIFSITPITNLPLLLGVSAEDSNSPPRT